MHTPYGEIRRQSVIKKIMDYSTGIGIDSSGRVWLPDGNGGNGNGGDEGNGGNNPWWKRLPEHNNGFILETLLFRRLLLYLYFFCCIIADFGGGVYTQALIDSGAHIELGIPEEVIRNPFLGEYPPLNVYDERPPIFLSIRDVAYSLMVARRLIREEQPSFAYFINYPTMEEITRVAGDWGFPVFNLEVPQMILTLLWNMLGIW